jgi:tetratricopeptide (TPR) repeat protein
VRDFIFYASDDLDAAAEHAAATYALAERVPNRTIRGAASVTLAAIHFLRGEYAEAKRWADVGLEVSEQIANLSAAASAAAIAVLARLELGEPVAPERYLEVMDQGAGVAGATLSNLRLVGEAFLALDDLVRAERYAEQLRGHVGGRLRDAHLATLLGEIMTRRGRHDVAERHFAEAIGAAEAIGVRSLAAAAALGAAELAAARGDAATAARHRQQARTIATELRLGRYLARARRLPGAPEAVADRAV